jgi:ADP-ribosyl-[dinitrogen reductase] hydrolase
MTDQKETDTTALRSFEAQRDRAIGAFVGLAVGDALGTTIEFTWRNATRSLEDEAV